MIPKRIQRKRTKGWTMPKNTVYVGRPTKWGNPFHPENYSVRIQAVDDFRKCVFRSLGRFDIPTLADIRKELRGKDLACWCPLNHPCHADILLEIANDDL